MTDLIKAMPGYMGVDVAAVRPPSVEDDWTPDQWAAEYKVVGDRLRTFLASRDPWVVLARTASRHILEYSMQPAGPEREPEPGQLPPLIQTDVELLQALVLSLDRTALHTPTSPNNFIRFWPLLARRTTSFLGKLDRPASAEDAAALVARRARVHSVYYRNHFERGDCERVVTEILRRIDSTSMRDLGYPLSELWRAMIFVINAVTARFDEFGSKVRALHSAANAADVLAVVDWFRSSHPTAAAAWRTADQRISDLRSLKYAALQVSELAHPWIFTIASTDLSSHFSPEVVAALFDLALAPGGLSATNSEHFHLQNPIWCHPYVRLGNDLFAPNSQLALSFPFLILEGVMEGHPKLMAAYEKARADYLEEAIEITVQRAIPSARCYKKVTWIDPNTGKRWENDVVAVVGNFIFLFEAKSGRIKDAARRGGLESLQKNFKELFVEPGKQAWRLQDYLDTQQSKAVMRLKKTGEIIGLDLDRPKLVFRFSICIEHFGSLTGAKRYLKELDLIEQDTAWAPVLSIGELLMLDRYLDCEISFIHYLCRRASIEHQLDVEGDEQDLLSVYLTNGFYFDQEALVGQRLFLHNVDWRVRQPKQPRTDRTVVELPGVHVTSFWLALVKDIYALTEHRNRFDIIINILNQTPPRRAELERSIRRWRRGEAHRAGDILFAQDTIAERLFSTAIFLLAKPPSELDWHPTARDLAANILPDVQTADMVIVGIARRSKQSYDALSFFRVGKRPEAQAA